MGASVAWPQPRQTIDVGRRYGSWVTRLFVLLLFALFTVFMTWPLILNLQEAIPGPPWDNFVWLYDLWWFRHSVVDLGQWPTFNPTIFYPYGYDLSLSETMYANKLLIAPVLFWGDEVLAYNILVLLTFILTGYTTYLLIAYLTDNQYAAVVGAATFAFCPYRMHALAAGWLPLLATQWIPLAFLYLERTLREDRTRYALLAGLFLALTFLSSWYYVLIVGGMTALYLLVRLLNPSKNGPDRGRAMCHLALAFGVTLLLVLPVALPVMRNRSGQMSWSLVEVEKWAASLEDFILPGIYHPVWGEMVLQLRAYTLRYPWYAPGFVSLGVLATLLALKGWTSSRVPLVRPLFWMGAISFLLALGAVLHWNHRVVEVSVSPWIENLFLRGMSTLMSKLALHKASIYDINFNSGTVFVPLPALLLYLFFPLGNAVRTYYRFGLMTIFAVSILAGFGVAAYTGGMRLPESIFRLRGRYDLSARPSIRRPMARPVLVAALLVVAVLAEYTVAPLGFGLSEVRPQPLDNWLAAQPAEVGGKPVVVMQFPLTRALSGDSLYRTRFHRKNAAYGHGTFYPDSYWYAMPLLGTFPSENSLRLLQGWGVTYVAVCAGAYDAGWGDLPDQTWRQVEEEIIARARAGVSPYLRFVGVVQDEPFWRDERVSHILFGNPPVVPILIDKVYIYELK
ncbi:MAG: hypothetical protein H5T69_14330 [Chloroflexi bacterium]|nr:hypothetical protein [Chloroflexota bacterium]